MLSSFFAKNYATALIAILFFAFIGRIYQLHQPEKYIFDEVYHAVTAKLIAKNDPRAFEWWNPPPEPNTAVDWLHPPLAKYTQALSIAILGETSFAWRLSSALFGVAVVYLVAHLALTLTKNHTVALLSAFLTSLDGLLLVMSRIAMNDIHVTFAILLTLVIYLKTQPFEKASKNKTNTLYYLLTGIAAGSAMGTKWSGVFVLGIIFFYEGLRLLELFFAQPKKVVLSQKIMALLFELVRVFVFLVFIPVCVYVLSYSQMFLQGKDLTHFFELHSQIWGYQNNLAATHTYQSSPSEWVLNTRPVWFHVVYEPGKRGDIYAHGNSIILWSGLLAVIFFSVRILKKLLNVTDTKKPFLTLLSVFRNPLSFILMSYYAMWVVWTNSPRIMFFYHYTPAIPFLTIVLAYGLVKLTLLPEKHQPIAQAVTITVILLAVLYFALFIPHWLGIPVKAAFVESVYFMFESWK